ncbi:MAG TPA: SET domain-containing protein-lysine N-methyltransferase [Gemmataceae bacterium]|jgi:hypothetical protein|nr:SET domain-containing protein-lysine N-methyltransferase [Gemmataceae bacterium]
MKQSDLVCVKVAPGKGRGVFAAKPIKKGKIIERVPLLIMPADTLIGGLHNAHIGRFYYWWTNKKIAVALGYGSLYNHSFDANASYKHEPDETLKYIAIRDIAVGEEVTINYNGDPNDQTPVDFKVVR